MPSQIGCPCGISVLMVGPGYMVNSVFGVLGEMSCSVDRWESVGFNIK